MNNSTKKIISKILQIIFYISQFYWLFFIGESIYCAVNGVDTGWFGSTNIVYGMKAVKEILGWMIIISCMTPYMIIPIYQFVYCIANLWITKDVHKKIRIFILGEMVILACIGTLAIMLFF